MADFLKELKAKRLRKISNAPDGSFVLPVPPDSSIGSDHSNSRSVSSEDRSILSQLPLRPPRPSTIAASEGASAVKRKRGTDDERNASSACKCLGYHVFSYVLIWPLQCPRSGFCLPWTRQFDLRRRQDRIPLHFTRPLLGSLEFLYRALELVRYNYLCRRNCNPP